MKELLEIFCYRYSAEKSLIRDAVDARYKDVKTFFSNFLFSFYSPVFFGSFIEILTFTAHLDVSQNIKRLDTLPKNFQ